MYRTSQAPQDPYTQQQRTLSNGLGGQTRTSSMPMDAPPVSSKAETAPDLLTRAFNEALRPHQERVDQLESELANLQAYVDQLEQQRSEIYSWIDKRGLRPGSSPSASPNRNLTLHH
jgi:hypothetical protein